MRFLGIDKFYAGAQAFIYGVFITHATSLASASASASLFRAERQSARMSKITNDGLTRSGTGCFIAVPMWQQWETKD